MDTQHLQAFVAVAEQGSFSGAALRLHLTQPAISKRIALLEEQVNAPLFNRIGRQISLTQAGQVLLPKAKLILAEVNAAAQSIADLQGDVSGKLSIATSHHIGLHYLPPYLQRFAESFPRVALEVHFLDSEQAYQEVLQGRFDLALITLALEPDPRIATHSLWRDELQFVAALNHPLARQAARTGTLRLAELSQADAIVPDPNTYTTQRISALFDAQSLPLNIGMLTNHLDAIKMLLTIGLGWGVLPSRLVDDKLLALPVQAPAIQRPLGVIHHQHRSLNRAASSFLALLQSNTLLPATST